MHARLRLDLGWSHLLHALAACVTARGAPARARRVERLFRPEGDGFAALSARSGLDLYLEALALPRGSEVLVSGLTIPHMAQILEAHGLRVVPFALDPETLAPAPDALEGRAGPRTRAVLFAHLFGQRADLGVLRSEAQRRGWLLWEDCAQAFTGDAWRGDPASDLALFSFGMIKTATALQGGLLRVKDADVRARMHALQLGWPRQSRLDLLRRTAKTAVLLALSGPRAFGWFARLCRWRGQDLDELLHAATRGFPGPDFLTRLRRAPSAPLLALLERRLARPEESLAVARRALGERLLAGIGPEARLVGLRATERHHWVFALRSSEPAQLVGALRAAGFDATARSSLVALEPAPEANRELLRSLVYVPLALRAGPTALERLVAVLRAESSARVLERPAGVPVLQPPAG